MTDEITSHVTLEPPEPKNIILKRIWQRLWRNNQNYILIVTGKTGSGKSYAALSIAKSIDPNFSIDHVVFSAKEFMQLIRSDKISKGSCIVWDESGVGLGARDFASIANKALNYFLQSFRCMNICLILTLPVMGMLDVTGRRLAHGYMETIKINREKGITAIKMFDIQTDPKEGEVYYHYPKMVDADGAVKTIKHVKVHKPNVLLYNAYEAKRGAWLESLANTTLNTITNLEKKEIDKDNNGRGKSYEIKEYAERVNKEFPELQKIKNGKPYYNVEMLQLKLEIGAPTARMLKCYLEEQKSIS